MKHAEVKHAHAWFPTPELHRPRQQRCAGCGASCNRDAAGKLVAFAVNDAHIDGLDDWSPMGWVHFRGEA